MSHSTVIAWTWIGFVVAATVALILAIPDSIVDVGDALNVTTPTLLTVLGVLIATRQEANRIGWLMILVGASFLIEPTAILILSGGRPDPVTTLDVLAVIGENTAFFVGFIIPFALLLYLFPTGQYMTHRWSWAGWFAVVSSLAFLIDALLKKEMTIHDAEWTVVNPIGILSPEVRAILANVAGIGMLTLMGGGIVAIVVRYRRSDPTVRSQIKLVALFLVCFIAVALYRLLADDRGNVSGLVFGLATVLIPISITLAIVRHRLFDIDRLIARTVGYALVVGMLTFVYVAGALWLPTQITGDQSPIFVAASTLAVAALFNPLRRRVIRAVDRRFNRAGYDAQRVMAKLTDLLQDKIDVDEIAADSLSVITETMQPSSLGVWIRR
ncbi:MAG: hypothetical protein WBZ40_13470 [Acidimicrobiia bacterium]